MARSYVQMAQTQQKYGSALDNLYGSMMANKYGSSYAKYSNSTQTLNDLLNSNALKNKSDEFRSQFSDLYKSIFGTSANDENSLVGNRQAVKAASANVGGSAESIKDFANKLSYGGELDVDAYKAQAQSFVDNYNSMIDKLANSENQSVLQKGVLMVNTAKVYTSSLQRAGITLGSDNKLTLADDLSKVKALDVKTLFGTNGFSDKVISKARDINSLSGGYGVFTKSFVSNSSSSSSATDDGKKDEALGSLKELTSAVKDTTNALKDFVQGLGKDDVEFSTVDYTDTAKSFAENFNKLIDQLSKTDNKSVKEKGTALNSMVKSYQFALKRAGITVGNDGKLTINDVKDLKESDVKYALDNSMLDKIIQKADQIGSLSSSASAMGYSANSTAAYAYNIGALFNVYA